MEFLKIIALEADDLPVISTHMQDAIVRIGDMHFDKARKQFSLLANRFDWQQKSTGKSRAKTGIRQRTGITFSQVLGVRSQKIRLCADDAILSLLAIEFEPGKTAPEGQIRLLFSGGGTLELAVECLEVQMEDLGSRWETQNVPTHDQE